MTEVEIEKMKEVKTENPGAPKNSKWRALQDNESSHWPIVRFAFWPISTIAIWVIAYLVSMPAERLHDFSTQTIVFSALGLGSFILGSVVGYRNWEKRKLWILADFIWVMIVLFSLGKNLTPIENYLGTGKVEIALASRETARENVLRKTWEATDQLCVGASTQSRSAEPTICTTLRKLERQLNLPRLRSHQDIVQALTNTSSPNVIGELATLLDRYDQSWDEVAKVGSKRQQINLWFPYLQILIITIALGLRAGRTGAEFRREVDKAAEEKSKKSSPTVGV